MKKTNPLALIFSLVSASIAHAYPKQECVSLNPSQTANIVREMCFSQLDIAGKEFLMGSPDSECKRDSDENLHRVVINHNYEVQTDLVTQGQWFEVMGTCPSFFNDASYCPGTAFKGISSNQKPTRTLTDPPACPENPVENVSWENVQKFISKLNDKLNDRYSYRLPTEAEWEYAARGDVNTAYYFGDDFEQLPLYAWYKENSGGHTHEVGTKSVPNNFGLFDIAGNVWQWVFDRYQTTYSGGALDDSDTPAVVDPTGPVVGTEHVVRGGGWFSEASKLRLSSRDSLSFEDHRPTVGFRLVRIKK